MHPAHAAPEGGAVHLRVHASILDLPLTVLMYAAHRARVSLLLLVLFSFKALACACACVYTHIYTHMLILPVHVAPEIGVLRCGWSGAASQTGAAAHTPFPVCVCSRGH
eukprot:450755-Pelagomonas_calceolata.AAC.3